MASRSLSVSELMDLADMQRTPSCQWTTAPKRRNRWRNIFPYKVGLALSGGGFRTSLYHIGVPARLAELDMLRYVEVISCVSVGSILGTYYYLELRRRLRPR